MAAASSKHSGSSHGDGGGLWATNASLTTLQMLYSLAVVANKFVLDNSLPPEVTIVYKSIFALAFLAPFAYFTEREACSSFDMKALCTICAGVGALGLVTQLLMMYGLAIGTASLGALIPIEIPVFVVLISAVFRLEDVDIRRRDGQARIGGVLSAVAGVTLMTLYRGPMILGTKLPVDEPGNHGIGSDQNYGSHRSASSLSLDLDEQTSSWRIGLILLLSSGFLFSVIYCVQVPILKRFPAPFSVAALQISVTSVLSAAVAAGGHPNASAWVIPGFDVLASLFYLGVICTGVGAALQVWTIQRSGPLLVALYNPVQCLCTALFSYLLLGDALYLGTALGALLIINGLFLVTWGRFKYQKEVATSASTPLLLPDELALDVPPVAAAARNLRNEDELHEPLMA